MPRSRCWDGRFTSDRALPAWLTARALETADLASARALVAAHFAGTLYEARILEQLEIAARGDDPECRGIVALAPDEQRVRGFVLLGAVAGAEGVWKVHFLISPERNVLTTLADVARQECRRADQRMLVCELADDAPFDVTGQVLHELGFEEAGRVADYFREGVALVVLTRRNP